MNRAALILVAALVLAACKDDDAATPVAVEMTDEALGHYCQMYVADHPGPKAQIFLKGFAEPLWFSQISDARAYVFDPERESDIVAIYVNDLAMAESWGVMGQGNWIPAQKAVYVIESSQLGGMGTPEALPYATPAAAEAAGLGGRIVEWDDIPEAYVRPDWVGTGEMSNMDHGGHS